MKHLSQPSFMIHVFIFFLFFNPVESFAQTYKLKGQVLDSNRKPVKNVFISTTHAKSKYVTTNGKGKFSIKVSGYDTLLILSVQEELFMVSIENRKEAVFILESSGKQMTFDTNIYSVLQDIKKEKMLEFVEGLKAPPEKFYSSIYEMIRQECPEVSVNEGTGEVIVRGTSSLNYTNPALIVVDGVKGVKLSSLNPIDVESIRVIKDATAGMYGGRAVGGVIEITTKKGAK